MSENWERSNDMVLAKWQRDKDRLEAKAEAMKESVKKGLAELTRDINIRAGIAKEIHHARYVEGAAGLQRLRNAAGGDVDSHLGRSGGVVEGEFTGYAEDRPWERE